MKLKVTKDGPYLLTGVTQVTRISDGKVYEVSGTAALCRCGSSKNKPFCDGTHKTIGFTGDKAQDRTPDKVDEYVADEITVRDNRGLCAHAGRCTDGSPAVFRLRKEPFVDASAAPPEDVAATIGQCPSGALSYDIAGVAGEVGGGEPAVLFVPNGPYAIKGGAELEGAELGAGGTAAKFTLCRCGASKNKPFCNGAHWGVQFDEDAPNG